MIYIRIAIGGLTGCGKTTLGEKLAERLGIEHITFTFKDLAKEEGISLMKFQKKAEKDHEIDKKFDQMILNKIKETENFVITTWLGPWYDKLFGIKYDLKIWLSTPDKIKSERLSRRDNVSKEEALKHLKERDKNNRERYLSVYNIDIFDNSSFDLKINNGKLTPEKAVELILDYMEKRA